MDQLRHVAERGGSKLNLMFALAIMGAMIVAGWKMIPPYFANYQFQDAIESESRFALSAYPKKSPDDILDDVSKKAQELGIQVNRQDIKLNVDRGVVDISLDYTVPVDLFVYQINLHFHPHADNRII